MSMCIPAGIPVKWKCTYCNDLMNGQLLPGLMAPLSCCDHITAGTRALWERKNAEVVPLQLILRQIYLLIVTAEKGEYMSMCITS